MAKRAIGGGGLLAVVLGTSVLCGSCDDGVTAERAGALISDSDDRIESSQVTDPNVSKLAYGTAAMWLGSLITDNGNGQSTITSTPYSTRFGQPLCPGTKFLNQPVGGGLGCTAFLVGPDLVATANHCLTEWGWTWDKWRILFGYTMPVWSMTVSNSKIFRPTAVLASDSATDTALLQLDRSVPEWFTTFPLDPAPKPTDTQFQRFIDSVASFGHGLGLPLKYSPNTGPYAGAYTFGDYYFLSYLDLLPGNSGSPVFDTATSMVRGILTGQYVEDYVWDQAGACYRLQSYSPAQFPVFNSVTSSYVQPIANLVTPAGSLLEPTYRSAKTLAYAPSSVVLDSGDEYVFITAADYKIYSKHRDAQNAWSAWSEVPGYGTLQSAPAAVAGMGDMWLFGRDSSGALRYNRRYANGTWSNWGIIDTPTSLAAEPTAFAFDSTGPGGVFVRVVVLSMLGTDGVGRMKYITYRREPNVYDTYNFSNSWETGAYAAVAGAASVATGFNATGNAAIATIVNSSHTLGCARGLLASIPGQGQPASINWSACVRQIPTNVQVLNAQGIALDSGAHYVVARAADDTNVVVSRSTATGVWGAWTAFGGRSFATPSLTKSFGSWWTYTQTADRRLAIK